MEIWRDASSENKLKPRGFHELRTQILKVDKQLCGRRLGGRFMRASDETSQNVAKFEQKKLAAMCHEALWSTKNLLFFSRGVRPQNLKRGSQKGSRNEIRRSRLSCRLVPAQKNEYIQVVLLSFNRFESHVNEDQTSLLRI